MTSFVNFKDYISTVGIEIFLNIVRSPYSIVTFYLNVPIIVFGNRLKNSNSPNISTCRRLPGVLITLWYEPWSEVFSWFIPSSSFFLAFSSLNSPSNSFMAVLSRSSWFSRFFNICCSCQLPIWSLSQRYMRFIIIIALGVSLALSRVRWNLVLKARNRSEWWAWTHVAFRAH